MHDYVDELKFVLCVSAQRSLTACKKTVDDGVTSRDCDDVTMMTSLKDVYLLTLPCNHVPVDLTRLGQFGTFYLQ